MTVDDLLEEFRNHPTTREGVKSIVRALRDETCGNIKSNQSAAEAWAIFEEILGEAGEKVGTHGSPELDEDARKLEAMGQDPGMTLEELLAPDAAPAVCVWTQHAEKRWSIQCAAHGFFNPTPKRLAAERCAMCKAPIKFTEAK